MCAALRGVGRATALLVAAGVLVAAVLAPLALAGAAPAREPESRGQVAALHDLVAQMAQRVREASVDGYLRLIDNSDPVFATEQRNWIVDVESRNPERFELELVPGSEALARDGATARGEMRARWKMPSGPVREVSYPASFVLTERGWRYAGRAWLDARGPGVLVRYAEGLLSEAEDVIERFPAVAAHVEEGFGLERGVDIEPDRVQQIKLYSSMPELQYSIYPSYRDPLGGWNEPGESMKLLIQPGTRNWDRRVLLAHEYAHVATFLLGERANEAPWWVLEGVAELASERWGRGRERVKQVVSLWASRGELAEWADLADFRGIDPRLTSHVYIQGHSMMGYVSERYGREGRNRWLAAMARGSTLDEATQGALGLSFAELDAAWRARVSDQSEDEQAADGD